jgi:hypothetical protein
MTTTTKHHNRRIDLDEAQANYTRVREMLEVKYGPRLPAPE